MGCPAISRSGLPGRRVDPKRAGITARKLINDQSAHRRSRFSLHQLASLEYHHELETLTHRRDTRFPDHLHGCRLHAYTRDIPVSPLTEAPNSYPTPLL